MSPAAPGYGPPPPAPSCIVAEPGDDRTLCGAKTKLTRISLTWARFVQAHTDGHDQPWCATCHELWTHAGGAA